jgi:transcriptional regulator with XRE-family HTH domain
LLIVLQSGLFDDFLRGTRLADIANNTEYMRSTETVSRFERGSNLPSLHRLEKLAEALKIPLYKLVAASSPRHDDQSFILEEWMSELTPKDREFAMNTLKQLCAHLAGAAKCSPA